MEDVAGIGALLRPNKYSILKFVNIHPGVFWFCWTKILTPGLHERISEKVTAAMPFWLTNGMSQQVLSVFSTQTKTPMHARPQWRGRYARLFFCVFVTPLYIVYNACRWSSSKERRDPRGRQACCSWWGGSERHERGRGVCVLYVAYTSASSLYLCWCLLSCGRY
jgi:hypothetical protein